MLQNVTDIQAGSTVVRLIISIIAVLVLLSGILLVLSPIPVGALLIAASLSVLIYVSTTAQNILKKLRKNYYSLNEKMIWLEEKTGDKVKFISQSLIKTRPEFLDNEGGDK
ncbi:hypothetical protein [Kaarinaea lacus]